MVHGGFLMTLTKLSTLTRSMWYMESVCKLEMSESLYY